MTSWMDLNHSAPIPGVEESPDKSAYLFWQDGVPGIEAEDKAVGPSIILKVNKGDKVSMETWARYESKMSYARDVPLLLMSQLLGSNFAFTGGFEANNVVQTTDAFEELLVPGVLDDGTDDSKPFAYLNYIVFNDDMEVVTSGWKRVNGDGAFDPGEEAYADMHEHVFIDDTIAIAQNGYIYVWVSNESEDTKVWFDDLKVTHEGGIVTQATDFGVWGDVLREEKADESAYRFGYQGQFSEKDLETGWNHFELREYDPIIGRWLVPDPLHQYWSPYKAMGNNPINMIDRRGGEGEPKDGDLNAAGTHQWGLNAMTNKFEWAPIMQDVSVSASMGQLVYFDDNLHKFDRPVDFVSEGRAKAGPMNYNALAGLLLTSDNGFNGNSGSNRQATGGMEIPDGIFDESASLIKDLEEAWQKFFRQHPELLPEPLKPPLPHYDTVTIGPFYLKMYQEYRWYRQHRIDSNGVKIKVIETFDSWKPKGHR